MSLFRFCYFLWKGGFNVARNRKIQALFFLLGVVVALASAVPAVAEEAPQPPAAVPAPGATAAPAPQTPAPAAAPKIDKGDNAWMLTSSALVLMMTIPGLFLFYGGLVRGKNALGTIMHSFIIVALISIQWVLWGYSLAFGPDKGGIVGSLAWLGLNGVGLDPNPDYAATIPHQTFMIYQAMFAIITPALITGAFAERAKFSTFIIFILLWATFIY
ncbi:MAG: ammonium transporter, partial [Deltaproteobacteria bacterium]|nr:ammonium transporter [Deltaproteobacteria bacterium]